MGHMSDLDIVRQEHGLPTCTPLEVLRALSVEDDDMANNYAYAQRVSLLTRKLHAEGIYVSDLDMGRDGDYPTIDGMDGADWFEAMTGMDYCTAPSGSCNDAR